MTYINENFDKIEKLKSVIDNADAIVIGAGAGLSTAAGYEYCGKRFHEKFSDFEAKYNFHDMYTGGFYPYSTLEEYWAYWSRYILINRYSDPPKPVYDELYEMVKNKNYFVITTNVDHCFQKAGFDKKRLFYTQGDYGLFQCSVPCHDKTYDNEDVVRRMVSEQKDMKIPSELVPRCPICKKPMTMNLRADDSFVEDRGWHDAYNRYERFLRENANKKIVFLELGVGMNTPAIIKFPFWRMTDKNPNAYYVCINTDEAYVPDDIQNRSLCISDDIAMVLAKL
ncbi:MAG TPA: Sir2 silent information regulator family NAD-dependent deacetylase [Clostridiales bacterium]|nr:Sir2 silent information regulator family NAD-dependent deacetylase [Clostridiales bacterium]HCH92580.1 Sir2 silent information regulator family NAD-dependent deacetylase [Clostridiales bacterium]